MELLKKKKVRILMVSFLGGILINLLTGMFTKAILNGGNQWTQAMGDKQTLILTILAMFYIIVTGILCLKDLTKKEVLSAIKVMIIWNILYIVFEQLAQRLGTGYEIMLIFLIPMSLYTFITSWIVRWLPELSIWIAVIPSIFAPAVYYLFAKIRCKD